MKKFFTLAISLLFSTFAFAELPHTFKNGDILNAEMLNQNFEALDENGYSTIRANGKIIGRGAPDHRELEIILRNDYKVTTINNKGELGGDYIYFSGENCTGTPYSSFINILNSDSLDDYFKFPPNVGKFIGYKNGGSNMLYYYPPKAQLYKSTVRSYWSYYNQTCINEIKNNQLLVKLLPNDPAVTGVEVYPFPTPITIDGFTESVIVE